MIKLLTTKESFANCVNKYNEDSTAFTTEGEIRGKMKQRGIEWHSEEDYISLESILTMLGLNEYVEMMLDEDMLYMRIIEDSLESV